MLLVAYPQEHCNSLLTNPAEVSYVSFACDGLHGKARTAFLNSPSCRPNAYGFYGEHEVRLIYRV